MQYTPNFNFNLPEGTDLWNYLTQTNPNFAALDTLLKGIQDGTVTTATEVASGTAHAITRTLPDANVIRFTATSAWTLGDTMTIDGTPVTVVKPNGTNLQTGDYIIGSEVLGVLRATQFTVYLGAPSSLDASDITYDNTTVESALNDINSNLATHFIKNHVTTPSMTVSNGLFECIVSNYVPTTGYAPLGIIGYELSRREHCAISGIIIDKGQIKIQGYNSGSATTTGGYVDVLEIKQ